MVVITIGSSFFISVFIAVAFDELLCDKVQNIQIHDFGYCIDYLKSNTKAQQICLVMTALIELVLIILMFSNKSSNYNAELYDVTPEISIPVPCGQKQHGSAWWTDKKKFNKKYKKNKVNSKRKLFESLMASGYDDLPPKYQSKSKVKKAFKNLVTGSLLSLRLKRFIHEKPPNFEPFKKGGLVVACERKGSKDILSYIDGDIHSLILGVTGSGKSRFLVDQTICNLALAGESMFITDIKGELFLYTSEFLKKLGYNVVVLDFKNMEKSMSYNPLQPIIDELRKGNLNKAMQKCNDIANMIVGEKNKSTEPIWHDGQLAVLSASIMACVYDNELLKRPERQNLYYVYEFITRMCAEKKGKQMLLIDYLQTVGEDHPANLLLAQANVAPSKTRGSFYTSAATTLSLFTDNELYHIIKRSDFNLADIANKKTVMFIILPEGRTTFYKLSTIIVSQLYDSLMSLPCARLPRRVNFVLDEFGNFSKISEFDSKLTLCRAKGMRFNLFLQSFTQLDNIYDDKVAEIIKSNCSNWIYLEANDKHTKEEISDRLGKYTTSSYSLSSSRHSDGSKSMNLIERRLLTTEEIESVQRPYQIVMNRGLKKVCYAPDLSKYYFNKMLGLGDQEHNKFVMEHRQKMRKQYNDVSVTVSRKGIWDNLTEFSGQYHEAIIEKYQSEEM